MKMRLKFLFKRKTKALTEKYGLEAGFPLGLRVVTVPRRAAHFLGQSGRVGMTSPVSC